MRSVKKKEDASNEEAINIGYLSLPNLRNVSANFNKKHGFNVVSRPENKVKDFKIKSYGEMKNQK